MFTGTRIRPGKMCIRDRFSIQFGQEFIKQLPDSDEKRLFENGISDMHIYPGKSWVMWLGLIVPDILKMCIRDRSINRVLLTESEKAAYFVKFNVDGLLRGDYQLSLIHI